MISFELSQHVFLHSSVIDISSRYLFAKYKNMKRKNVSLDCSQQVQSSDEEIADEMASMQCEAMGSLAETIQTCLQNLRPLDEQQMEHPLIVSF